MDRFWQNNFLLNHTTKKLQKILKHQSNQYNDTKDIEKLQI